MPHESSARPSTANSQQQQQQHPSASNETTTMASWSCKTGDIVMAPLRGSESKRGGWFSVTKVTACVSGTGDGAVQTENGSAARSSLFLPASGAPDLDDVALSLEFEDLQSGKEWVTADPTYCGEYLSSPNEKGDNDAFVAKHRKSSSTAMSPQLRPRVSTGASGPKKTIDKTAKTAPPRVRTLSKRVEHNTQYALIFGTWPAVQSPDMIFDIIAELHAVPAEHRRGCDINGVWINGAWKTYDHLLFCTKEQHVMLMQLVATARRLARESVAGINAPSEKHIEYCNAQSKAADEKITEANAGLVALEKYMAVCGHNIEFSVTEKNRHKALIAKAVTAKKKIAHEIEQTQAQIELSRKQECNTLAEIGSNYMKELNKCKHMYIMQLGIDAILNSFSHGVPLVLTKEAFAGEGGSVRLSKAVESAYAKLISTLTFDKLHSELHRSIVGYRERNAE